jgi:hypothetical protein
MIEPTLPPAHPFSSMGKGLKDCYRALRAYKGGGTMQGAVYLRQERP